MAYRRRRARQVDPDRDQSRAPAADVVDIGPPDQSCGISTMSSVTKAFIAQMKEESMQPSCRASALSKARMFQNGSLARVMAPRGVEAGRDAQSRRAVIGVDGRTELPARDMAGWEPNAKPANAPPKNALRRSL